jgi:pyroglutamyl-peptidase
MMPVVQSVLLTGFEPFDAEPVNPSWLAAKALEGELVGGGRVTARQLPCVFGVAIAALERAIAELDPVLVVCTGQAAGRTGLSLERVAINVDDARIPDNVGKQPIDEAIAADGPAAYFSTLPIKSIAHALLEVGVRAEISQTAGTFVCNHVFYGLMRTAEARGLRAGFVHVPLLPEQAARMARGPVMPPSMPLEDMVRGLRLVIATALEVERDARHAGGAIS